jgi:hypothetical protein
LIRGSERQIAATDQQIDRLVYELYELTEEEIKIGGEHEIPLTPFKKGGKESPP